MAITSMDKKRIFLAIGFLIFCIVLGYLIYRVFFKKSTTVLPPSQTTTTGGSTFPTVSDSQIPTDTTEPGTLPIGTGQINTEQTGTQIPVTVEIPNSGKLITKVVDVAVLDAAPGQTGNARFYNKNDGKFYTVNSNGQVQTLSQTVFYNVENVMWSPNANGSIIEYPDGSNIYYNFDTNTQVTLPKHWESFSFSKAGNQISAKSMGLSPDSRWLITSDTTGNSIQLLEPLGDNASKVIVNWSPNQQVVALSATGESLGSQEQEILLIGQNHENFKSIIVAGRGLEAEWSPQGTKLLHSVYNGRNDYKPELWIVDATPDTAGGNRKPLGVNTWASKCTMADERTVYCGVPEILQTGAGFAPEVADFTRDFIYKIDTVTGIRTEIPTDVPYVVDSMFVSQDGSQLFFTDKNQAGIYSVPLK